MNEPLLQRWIAFRYLTVMLAACVLTVLLVMIREHLTLLNAALIYLLFAVLAAGFGGVGAGLIASVMSAIVFEFLFVPPIFGFEPTESANLLSLAVFLCGTLANAVFLARSRRQTAAALLLAEENRTLFELSTLVNSNLGVTTSLVAICARTRLVFNAEAARILTLDGDRLAVAAEDLREDSPRTDESRSGLDRSPRGGDALARQTRIIPLLRTGRRTLADPIEIPMTAAGATIGALRVSGFDGTAFDPDQAMRLLHAAAQVAALAVQHARMQEDVMSAMALQEADSLKSALLAAVTHELRAPLGTILTAVTGLLDEAKRWTGTERRDLLAAIQEETEGLTTFVNDVLDLSRIEGGALRQQRDWYNLREFLETVVDRWSAIAATHDVIVETSDDATEGYFDYAQLVQVVGNVLDNAAKFSPSGTTITLRGSRSATDVMLTVQDNGIGVAPDEAKSIFDRFYRGTHVVDRIPGSGLGLAICKGIVEAHGGVIEVQPSARGGSIFSISIPQPPRVDGSEDDGS